MGRSDNERLLEAARAGDPDAWETLYRGVYPRLRSYVASRVGYGEADDLVSETMTRAVASIDRLRLADPGFDGWVFGIARRVTADHLRRSSRRRSQPVTSLDRSSDAPDVHAGLAEEDEYTRLRAALARLSADDRELLELRATGRFSIDEIAHIVGKRPGAVRTASSRAVARLRCLLETDVVEAESEPRGATRG